MNLLADSSRRNYYLSIVTISLMATTLLFGVIIRPSHAQTLASNTGVVIPLYNYPDSTWTTIEQTATAYPSVPIIAVINPNNGPGSSADPTYLVGVQNLQAAGVMVLGYVATGYGTSSYSALSQVEPLANDYKVWYHVNGIMFDEMSNDPTYESYYSTLNGYVKSDGMTYTMGNPGTSVPSGYIGILNSLCIYENAGYPTLSFISYPGYPNSDFAYIAYGVSFNSAFVISSAPDVGYVYIDNLSGGNPYSTLSSLFTQTVSTLSTIDSLGSSSSTSTTTSSSSSSATSSSSTTSASSTTTSSVTSTSSSASSTRSSSSSSTTSSSATSSSSANPIIKVRSVNSAGTVFKGMWTTVSSSSGALLAAGYTTFSFTAKSGTTYLVCVSNYKTTVFQHWGDGSTSPCETVTPTSNVLLTAYYGKAGTSQLTIKSQTTTGSSLIGFWTELYTSSGTVVATGYTPIAYTLTNGQLYTVEADSYGSCNFVHWLDNGSTNYLRTISISANTNLVAVYSC